MKNSNSKHRKKKRKSLSKRLPLFSEFGAEARDLLGKGYIKDHEFSISTRSSAGMTLSSAAVKLGKHSSSYLTAKYNCQNATIDVRVDSKSQLSGSLSFSGKFLPSMKTIASLKLSPYSSSETFTSAAAKLGKHSSAYLASKYNCKNATIDVRVDSKSQLPGSLSFNGKLSLSMKTIASLKLPHYSSSELQIRYFHEHVTLATSILLNQSPTVMLSASIGTSKIALGVEAKYKTESCSARYNASISLANSKSNASIILANQGDLLKASYVHHFKEISVGAEINRRFSKKESTFTVGGSCSVDHLTTVKMKLNNHGKLETHLSHKIRPKSCLSISGEVDMKALDRIPRIGLAVALML